MRNFKEFVLAVVLGVSVITSGTVKADWVDNIVVAGTVAGTYVIVNSAIIAATTETALLAINAAGQGLLVVAPTVSQVANAIVSAELFGGAVALGTVSTVPLWVPVVAGAVAATAVGVCLYDILDEEPVEEQGVCEAMYNRVREVF